MADVTAQKQAVQQRQLVVFDLADESYGVDIHQVREIIRMPAITRVPRTQDYVEGVINLRGSVIPVLNLRKRFGLEKGTSDEERRVIVIEMGDTTIGMTVDAVSEVLRLDESLIDPPSPFIVSVDSKYIAGIAKVDERLIILLDLGQVLSEAEKAQLSLLGKAETGNEGV